MVWDSLALNETRIAIIILTYSSLKREPLTYRDTHLDVGAPRSTSLIAMEEDKTFL